MTDPLDARLAAAGISRAEVEERFIRAGGKGGQAVNKLSTCVTLRHAPTGLVVRCDEERSQSRNRALAWERLIARVLALRRSAEDARRQAREKERRRRRPRPRGVQERILESKKRRARIKEQRRRVDW